MDIKKNSIQLSQERTNLADERTFLSTIRTTSIFAGLAVLLTKFSRRTPVIIILLICLLTNIYLTYDYYNRSKNYKICSKYYPIIYSMLISFILIILIYSIYAIKE